MILNRVTAGSTFTVIHLVAVIRSSGMSYIIVIRDTPTVVGDSGQFMFQAFTFGVFPDLLSTSSIFSATSCRRAPLDLHRTGKKTCSS